MQRDHNITFSSAKWRDADNNETLGHIISLEFTIASACAQNWTTCVRNVQNRSYT